MIVTNNSEYPQELREHCEIANLVLMNINSQAGNLMQTRNGHFAVEWPQIFENPIYPKWKDRKRSFFRKVWHSIRTYWYVFTSIGIVGIIANIKNIIDLLSNILKILNQ